MFRERGALQGFTNGCDVQGEIIKVFRELDHTNHRLGIYARNVGNRTVNLTIMARCAVGGCNQVHTWLIKPVSSASDADEDQSFTIEQASDPQQLTWNATIAQ